MTDLLFSLQDSKYRDFQIKLIPNLNPDTIIGVRTAELRKLAGTVDGSFRMNLPHSYFEENQIHAFSLEKIRDFELAVQEVEAFLPFVDNWATCDQLRPKIFSGHRKELLPHIRHWLESNHVYTIRFGMEMLMCHYLDDWFDPEYLRLVSAVRHEDYYVRMMVAWYFATALAKQFEAALPYITECHLDTWTHNKAIQKATESRRITQEQKVYLRQFKKIMESP